MTDTYPAATYGVPPPVKKKRKWLVPASLLLCGMLLGGGIASASKPEPVTIVQEKEVEKIVTKNVEVKVTPKECITALDLAGDSMGSISELGSIGKDGMNAAFARDATAIQAVTKRLETLNAELDSQTGPLTRAVSSCRAQAK